MSEHLAERPFSRLRQKDRSRSVLWLLVVWTIVQFVVFAVGLAHDLAVSMTYYMSPVRNTDFRWTGIVVPLGMYLLAVVATLPIQRRLGLKWVWRVVAGVTMLLGFLIFPNPAGWWWLIVEGLLFFLVPPLAGILVSAWRKGWVISGVIWVAMVAAFVLEPYHMAELWHWWW